MYSLPIIVLAAVDAANTSQAGYVTWGDFWPFFGVYGSLMLVFVGVSINKSVSASSKVEALQANVEQLCKNDGEHDLQIDRRQREIVCRSVHEALDQRLNRMEGKLDKVIEHLMK